MGNVKVKGCCDHEMVESSIIMAEMRVRSKLTTMYFRRTDFGLFKGKSKSNLN